VVQVPLYAYRDHGNGRIATFTSKLSGEWLDGWSDGEVQSFFGNVLVTNTPKERIDYPYDVVIDYQGDESTVEILPSHLNPRAVAAIKITSPGDQVTEKKLTFDLNRYFTAFKTGEIGKYQIEITYSYGTHTFTSKTYFDVSYYPEYNSFEVFDIANVHDFMRNRGGVYTDGGVDLKLDMNTVATYEYSLRIPLLIAAVALFVIDVFVRKTRWRDIKNFFLKKRVKEVEGK
jgi:hypothetical protein